MATSGTTWAKGKSGNPKGRPKKARALTELLERQGNRKLLMGDRSPTNKQEFATHVWEGLTRGLMLFHESEDSIREVRLEANEWVTLAKFVLGQIDGAPPPVEAEQDDGNCTLAGIEIVEVRLSHNPV